MISNLTIRKKMMLASAILVAVLLTQAAIINNSTRQIHKSFGELSSHDIQMLVLSKDIQFSIAQVQQWLTDISATRALDGLNDGFDEAASHASKLREYMQSIQALDPANTTRYQEISSAFETYYQAGQSMAKAYIKEGPAGGNLLMTPFDAAAARLIEQIEPLLEETYNATIQRLELEQTLVERLQSTSLLTTLVIFIFLAIDFFAINKSISSIDQLGKSLWNIADGDGDLTHSIEVKGKDEIAYVAEGFNRFIASIRSMVVAISQTSDLLTENAENSSKIMSKTNSDIASQKDYTAEVASAIHQISEIGQQASSKAKSAADAANETQQAASSGQSSVEEVVSSIDRLASEIATATQVIQRLGGHSDEIGNILNVIRGIAEQTNLLALNAAIEAARAGEQGRGFAVVADEVRTLATRTQDSTAEIQKTIEQLQQGSKEAINVIQTSGDIADTTVGKANHASLQLQSIVSYIKTINEVNAHIAQSTEQQNSMVSTVNRNIEHISEVADQTADGAQQTALASEDLLKLALQLRSTIKKFKV